MAWSTPVQTGNTGATAINSGAAGTILPSNVAIGDAVIVAIYPQIVTSTITSVTSPIGTFTLIARSAGATGRNDIEWWGCLAATAVGNTITANCGSDAWNAWAMEWPGAAASFAASGAGTNGTSTAPALTVTPTGIGQLIAVIANSGSGSAIGSSTPSSPWVPSTGSHSYLWQWTGADGFPTAAAYMISPSTSGVTATWAMSPSEIWGSVGAIITPVAHNTRSSQPRQAVNRASTYFRRASGLFAPERGFVIPRIA